jgi:hypothetical protein
MWSMSYEVFTVESPANKSLKLTWRLGEKTGSKWA